MYSRAHLLIQKEINDLENDPNILISRLNNDNIFELIALIEGQKSTIWENGVFQVYMKFTENYNTEPPLVYFQTIPYHPNIDMLTGKPSVDFLDNKSKWKPEYTIQSILKYLQQLLAYPLLDLAVNMEAVFMLKGNPAQYESITRQSVFATQRIRDILSQSGKNKSPVKIDIDLSKYFAQDIGVDSTNESQQFKKYPLFNIKREKTNIIRDKSHKKWTPSREKLFQNVSYDEYCTLWKGIATSKASRSDENAYLKNNLLENPNLLSQHLSISLKELEEQVYQQLKEHKNIIYGKFDFSDRNIDKIFTTSSLKRINEASANISPERKPEPKPAAAAPPVVHSKSKINQSNKSNLNDELFEQEVDDLIKWTKNIVS